MIDDTPSQEAPQSTDMVDLKPVEKYDRRADELSTLIKAMRDRLLTRHESVAANLLAAEEKLVQLWDSILKHPDASAVSKEFFLAIKYFVDSTTLGDGAQVRQRQDRIVSQPRSLAQTIRTAIQSLTGSAGPTSGDNSSDSFLI